MTHYDLALGDNVLMVVPDRYVCSRVVASQLLPDILICRIVAAVSLIWLKKASLLPGKTH